MDQLNWWEELPDGAVGELLQQLRAVPEFRTPSRYSDPVRTVVLDLDGIGEVVAQVNMKAIRSEMTRTVIERAATRIQDLSFIVEERRLYLMLHEHGVPLAAPSLRLELKKEEANLEAAILDGGRLIAKVIIKLSPVAPEGPPRTPEVVMGDARPRGDRGHSCTTEQLPALLTPSGDDASDATAVITALQEDPAIAGYVRAQLGDVRRWWPLSCGPAISKRRAQRSAFRIAMTFCALFGHEFPIRPREWTETIAELLKLKEQRRRPPGEREVFLAGLLALSRFRTAWTLLSDEAAINGTDRDEWVRTAENLRANYRLALRAIGEDPGAPAGFGTYSDGPRPRPVSPEGPAAVGLSHRTPSED